MRQSTVTGLVVVWTGCDIKAKYTSMETFPRTEGSPRRESLSGRREKNEL